MRNGGEWFRLINSQRKIFSQNSPNFWRNLLRFRYNCTIVIPKKPWGPDQRTDCFLKLYPLSTLRRCISYRSMGLVTIRGTVYYNSQNYFGNYIMTIIAKTILRKHVVISRVRRFCYCRARWSQQCFELLF